MNYDRRPIEALKRKQLHYGLPFLRLFVLLAMLVFVLSVLLR